MCPVGVRTSKSTQALQTGTAKLWMLLVGVNQYEDENIPCLRYAAQDCQGLGAALSTATQGFPQKELRIYSDYAADLPLLTNVRRSLEEIAAATKPIDTVLFYFSGHGMLEPSNQKVVLCLQDTQQDDLVNTGLQLQELLQILESCPAQQQLVWLDACHSGDLSFLGARGETSTLLNPIAELVEILRQRASQRKGFYALLSCDRHQQSWEFPQLGHGVFTYYLIRGLLGEAADTQGIIEADGLYRYLYHQTLAYIEKANQHLRVVNQLKKSRGDKEIHGEYSLQTPKRIVEGVGEVVLGIKPQQKGTSRHPRQALIVEGNPKIKTASALIKALSSAGDFQANYWSIHKNNPTADVRKAIQKCLLAESFSELPQESDITANTTIFLYLRGQIQATPEGEAVFILSDNTIINYAWFRKQLRLCRSQQIIIFDCYNSAVNIRDWIEELQLGIDTGQFLIATTAPLESEEKFTDCLLEILDKSSANGLTAASLITQLQLALASSDVQIYFWLSGSQGIIEVLPEKPLLISETADKADEKLDDLNSSVGIDYTHLQKLLQSARWLEADEETTKIMLQLGRREQENYLDNKSVANLPCTDLLTIDRLWVKYSQGRFGFSVQQRIYQTLQTTPTDPVLSLMIGAGKVAAAENCIDFANRVGWRMKDAWLDYHDLIGDEDAPVGHLPYFGFFEQVWRVKLLGVWEWHSAIATANWWELCVTLFSRLAECQDSSLP